MILLPQMTKSVEEALAFLRTQEDIEEAEVFVSSNGQLLCRLNYTSNIPSNGVEEPKSTENFGIGIRAVFKTPEGRKIGFGSEGRDTSLEGSREALSKARKGAILDPEFTTLPRPTGERRTLSGYHDPVLMNVSDDALVDVGWQAVEGALRTFTSSEALLAAAEGGEIAGLGLIAGGDITFLQERMAVASYAMPEVQTDESTLIMAYVTSMVERQNAKGSGFGAASSLAGLRPTDAGREAAESAINTMGGVRVANGEYRVVFGPQAVMDFMESLISPALNLGTFYSSSSPFQGKLGQKVASDILTIYDDGAASDLVASKGITCEGLPTGRTHLIQSGKLTGLLSNYYESQRILADPKGKEKLGVDPRRHLEALAPRNGFRFSRGGGRHYDAQPGIHGTNMVITGDGASRDELLQRVGDGLYIGRIWYTYPINGLRAGDFTSTVVGDSYLIRGGRLAEPIKANAIRINDNILRLIQGVIGVGANPRPTVVWAADEVVHASELAVERVQVNAIGGYMDTLHPAS